MKTIVYLYVKPVFLLNIAASALFYIVLLFSVREWKIQVVYTDFIHAKNLRGVASNPMFTGAELGVLDAVYLHHVHLRIIHAIVFVCQFIPCRL